MEHHRPPIADELGGLAVELSPAGMLAVDSNGTILLVNREIERLFGYARNELIGQPVEILVPERIAPSHAKARDGVSREGVARPMGAGRDLYGRRKDGTEVPVEIGLNSVETSAGTVVLASVVDISARRAAEDQLRQSQKLEAVGTLAGGIAHDFNNLLQVIAGHAELAQSLSEDRPKIHSDLQRIRETAERGRQLVSRLLTFARKSGTRRVHVAVATQAREALALLRSSLPSTIEIRGHIDEDTPTILADEALIHQVLLNLSTNAAHAMPGGGTLTIRVGRAVIDARGAAGAHVVPGPCATISVSDTGCGMTPEVLERAFEPFFSTKPSGVGTGLGLSILHSIVRSYGGSIDIESRPGLGTRVDVHLPASPPAVDATIASAATTVPAADAARDRQPDAVVADAVHVLLVEDEPLLAEMLERQVAGFGLSVTLHTSSVEALEDFRSRPGAFGLLITDNTMPRMTGLAFAREVLRLRPDIPVLMISGLAETADPELLKAQGIGKILPKPHTGAELRAAIRQLLGS